MSSIDAALAYAEHGFPVLPVRADKKPYTEHGLTDATCDEQTITACGSDGPKLGLRYEQMACW